MSPPKSAHPLAEYGPPPQEYTPCDIPNHLGLNFSDHDSFSRKNNKFYWLVYLGQHQGVYSLKATAVGHLGRYPYDKAMECFSTYDEVVASWKKHCFHHHGHCTHHSLACAGSPCARHAAPRHVMLAREKIATSYGLAIPRPPDDIPATRNPARYAGDNGRKVPTNSPAVHGAARRATPAVRDATRHVTPVQRVMEGRGIVPSTSGHGPPVFSPAPSAPEVQERARVKSERGLTPALGGLHVDGFSDETGKSNRWTPETSTRGASASRRRLAHSTSTSGQSAWSPKVEASIKEEEEENMVSGPLSTSDGDSVEGASRFIPPPPLYDDDSGPSSVPSSSMPPSSVSSLSASTSASCSPPTALPRPVYYVSNRTGFVFSDRASATFDARSMGFRVYTGVPDLIREAARKLSADGVASSYWFTSNSSKTIFPTIDYALDDAGAEGVSVLDGTAVDVAHYLKR